MNNIKHSWPRRSGKTGAAIMKCVEEGFMYWSPATYAWKQKLRASTSIEFASRPCLRCVIDDYEHCTEEQRALIAPLEGVHIFGTFGSNADDYRIGDAKAAMMAMESVEAGLISFELAMRDIMNIS